MRGREEEEDETRNGWKGKWRRREEEEGKS